MSWRILYDAIPTDTTEDTMPQTKDFRRPDDDAEARIRSLLDYANRPASVSFISSITRVPMPTVQEVIDDMVASGEVTATKNSEYVMHGKVAA